VGSSPTPGAQSSWDDATSCTTARDAWPQDGHKWDRMMQRLGHSSITTTLDVYGSLMPGLDEQVAADVERRVTHQASEDW
jgi:hypothetical protein